MAIQNQETPIYPIGVDGTDPDAWKQVGLKSADIRHVPTSVQIGSRGRQEDLLPQMSPNLLGHTAVTAHVGMIKFAIVGDHERGDRERKNLEFGIKKARGYLSELDPIIDKKIVTKLFIEFEMPALLKHLTGGQDLTPKQRLAALNAKDDKGVPRVPDPALLNFFEWRMNQMARKQAKFERETIAPMRQRYLERFQAAIKKGWLAQDTLSEWRQQYIRSTPVLMNDGLGLDSQFHSMFGGARAYALPQSEAPFIVVREDEDRKSNRSIEVTFTHEMTHILTGNTAPTESYMSRDEDDNPVTTYGVQRLFEFSTTMAQGLNEATTEHFTLALLGGDIDRVRVLQSQTYQTERYILKSVCEIAGISPRLFVHAMFEGGAHENNRRWPGFWEDSSKAPSSTDSSSPIYQLRTALEKAFPGQDIIGVLSAMKLEPALSSLYNLPQARREMRRLNKASAQLRG